MLKMIKTGSLLRTMESYAELFSYHS